MSVDESREMMRKLRTNTFTMRKSFFTEAELAALAKEFRERAGKSKSDVARELGVHRGTISRAEERPEQSLTSLRIRVIETYSGRKVGGPFFTLSRQRSHPH